MLEKGWKKGFDNMPQINISEEFCLQIPIKAESAEKFYERFAQFDYPFKIVHDYLFVRVSSMQVMNVLAIIVNPSMLNK